MTYFENISQINSFYLYTTISKCSFVKSNNNFPGPLDMCYNKNINFNILNSKVHHMPKYFKTDDK